MLTLKPAILYKPVIEQKFAERIYDIDMMYYNGYGFDYYVTTIKDGECRKEYACVDENDNVIGFFSYKVEALTKSVYNFGLISFDKGNLGFIKLIFNELEEMTKKYHRIEWRVVCGNPAERSYDQFCKKHNGIKYIYHDCSIDDDFNYHDAAVYEIITNIPLK